MEKDPNMTAGTTDMESSQFAIIYCQLEQICKKLEKIELTSMEIQEQVEQQNQELKENLGEGCLFAKRVREYLDE